MQKRGLWLGGLLAGCLALGCSSSSDDDGTGTTTDVVGDVGGGDAGGGDATNDDTATGDDTGGDDTTTGDTGGDDDTSAPAPTCEAYCDAVTTACTGDNKQYADKPACLAYCQTGGALPLGAAGDASGNTVGCRTYHAGIAAAGATEAAMHCPHAGPSGGDVCGTWCDNYCHLADNNCTGDNSLSFDVDCATDCASIAAAGEPGATAGDSVQCRIYHLGVASGTPEVHCPHGGTDGGGVCVDVTTPSCESYCESVTTNCTGTHAQYADKAACLDYCANWANLPIGDVADTSGNTVGCRLYHAGVAGSDGETSAATHCAHAGPTGGNVCGTWCDNYCYLSQNNCTGDDAIYADDAACQTECAAHPADANPGSTEGDSVQCRIYHLGVAGSNGATSAATHCPHGGADGAGVCVAAVEPSCAEYCTAITAACNGEFAQYASEAACLDYCAVWGKLPPGTVDDTSGNTIGCRTYHAGAAAANGAISAAVHCGHAGPSGGNMCGTWCDNYCHLAQGNCSGGNALFTDETDCQTACAEYPATGSAGDASGDTVQCKIYHLGVAGSNGATSADTHCPHGGVDGAGVCAAPIPEPSCTEYCDTVMASCTGEFAQYASLQACLDYCGTAAQLPLGTTADTAGNTVGCRTYHAGVAGSNGAISAAVHCGHAGPSGGNMCGTWCDNYCHLAQTNCSGGNGLFADAAECQTACAAYPASGSPGDASGDTVQCKIYHLGVAGSNGATSAATHCPHGGVDGAGVCAAPIPEPSCAQYCDTVMASCSGEFAQYASLQACLDYCGTAAQLPLGTAADTAGNTVGCRTYHAGVAGSNGDISAAVHCGHAGPSGGNMCGTWCDNYCHLAQTNCSGGNGLFVDAAECQTACAAYPASGSPGAASGDTVQCKIYHLGVAGSDGATSAATHCPHGGVDGAGVCAAPIPEPSCAQYCDTVMASCTGEFAQYASLQACLDYCGTAALLPLGTTADTSGNTVGCRTYHAGVAGSNGDISAAVHCGHAGPSGDDVCGTWCDNYCHLAQTNCSGGNALYADTTECLTACAAFDDGAEAGATSGDSVQCRVYHLGVAGSNGATSATTHCPHGGVDGGGVCADLAPATTFSSVAATFQAKCTPCHSGGGSGAHNIGSPNINTGYTESQKASYTTVGITKGAQALVYIKSGYMPLGGGCSGNPATDAGKANCLTAAEQSAIQAWLDDGQLAPAP